MTAVGKQADTPERTYEASTAAITPEYRAKVAADSIDACKADNLVAAGFLQDGQSFQAFANSNGNFGYQTDSGLDYTCTVRTEDGTGPGWVGRNLGEVDRFDAGQDIRTEVRKGTDSSGAKALEPGRNTVILEHSRARG